MNRLWLVLPALVLIAGCKADASSKAEVIVITGPGEGGGGGPPGQPPDLTFTLSANNITLGQSVLAKASCPKGIPPMDKGGDWDGEVNSLTLSEVITPPSAGTFSYSLTCSNQSGSVTETRTLVVTSGPAEPEKPILSVNPNLIWGSACPASGPSKAFVSSDKDISVWSMLDGALAFLTNKDSRTVTVNANTNNASGTARVVGTTPQGKADTVSVTVNACPSEDFTVGTPPQLRIEGNGCSMISATTTVSGGTIASVSGGEGVVSVTWTSSSVTFTPIGVGTRTLTFTTTDGRTTQVQVTVVECAGPTGQVTQVEVVPPAQDCVVGNHANFSAVVHYTGVISSTAVEWDVPSSSVASVVTRAPNDLVLRCNEPGTITVVARAVANTSVSDSGVLTVVNPPPAPTCPTTIDYLPAGGSLPANGTRTLAVQNWPSGTTNCQPFWYLSRPDVAQVAGADNIITIDGTQYYAGIHAVLRGVSEGTVIVCVQTSITTPEVKRCYDWTITPPVSADVIPYSEESGLILKYMNVKGVSQTYKGS